MGERDCCSTRMGHGKGVIGREQRRPQLNNNWKETVSNALHAIQRPAEWLLPAGAGISFGDLIAVRDKIGVLSQPPASLGQELLTAWARGEIYWNGVDTAVKNFT